jgi:trimeric autotransporter adhesin
MKNTFLNVWFRPDVQLVCVWQRFFHANYFRILFFSALFLTPSVLQAQISGTVFRDFNADGTKQVTNPIEPGLSGITVTAYNAVGTSLGTATTSTTGAYSFTVGTLASGTKVRLEFTLPTAYYPSNGSISNSNVQFVTAGTGITANLGINAPADYCHVTNPTYLLPCYVTNASTGSATASPALVTTTYLNGSTYGGGAFPITPLTAPFTTLLAADKALTPLSQTNGMSGATGTAPNMTGLATYGQIGTTWGTAYQRAQKQLFSAAFVKSNTDFGPLGIGGIYKTDLSTGTPTTSSFINLTAAPYNLSLGSVTRTLPASATVPYHDTDAFSKTCKIGLGGLEISDDDKTLWALVIGDNTTVTLASGAATTAKLVKMDIGIPATAPTSVTTYSIPNPACTGGNYRVFALKYYRGKLYVGGVCTAELAGTNTSSPNVKAIVYQFDPTAGTFTKVLDNSIVNSGTMGWSDTWSVLLGKNAGTTLSTTSGNYTYGRELALSDIDFDIDGSMILGFVDRSGFQIGFNNYSPVSTDNTHLYHASVAGDLLKACKNAAGTLWTLEVNGSASAVAGTCATSFGPTGGANNGQGPGNVGEFYVGDITFTNYDGKEVSNELGMGGLAMLYGSGQVLSTMSDVADFNSAGVSLFNNTTGLSDRRFQVLPDAGQTTGSSANGKANSLGEPTILCNVQPIEIGNIVWNDANSNGIQDAGEAGINGVIVELYYGATKVGTTTTTATGNFYFNKTNVNLNGATEIKPNTAYKIQIASSQFNSTSVAATPLSNLTLTTANATSTGLVDVADNDATVVSGLATISYTTGNYGENNHTLDFGFAPMPLCSITINTATPSSCNVATNTYSLAVVVTYTNPPTGNISINISGTNFTFTPSGTSPETFTITGLPSNGVQNIAVSVVFAGNVACSNTLVAAYNAPISCQISCCATSLITNGSFESGTWTGMDNFAGATNNATIMADGATVADNWITDGGYWVENSTKTTNGSRMIWIKPLATSTYTRCAGQDFGIVPSTGMSSVGTLVKGKKYKLCFDYAAFDQTDPNNAVPGVSNLELELGTQSLFTIPTNTVAWSQLPAGWQHFSNEITVPASAGSPLRLLLSTNQTGRGMLFDNVTLCEVLTCDTSLTVNNTTICNGAIVNLYAQTSGIKGTLTYSTNGTTWLALTNPTNVTPSVSTTYFVKDSLTGGCFDSDTLTITVNTLATITSVHVDTATCVNGVMGSNAAVAVRGIVGMTKYAYSIGGTSGLNYYSGIASTLDSIRLSGLANPSVSTTYTFRIYGTDTTCYEDITAVLTPSVCPPCSIIATFTQGACNNNGTTATATDDYFTVAISGVSSTNGGTSGKYEVILNGNVLNIGGTTYGTSVIVGGILDFKSDGATTYNLTVRDMDIPTCVTTLFTTTASAACSTTPCKPDICLPVTVIRN